MISLELILILLAAGALAGLIAGLFGVGGGIVVIPVSLWVLDMQFPASDYIQHMAVATSFTVMVFTTLSSSVAHYRKKVIRWDILRPMIPGIILGSILGALLASHISSRALQLVFVVFAYSVSIKTIVGFKPKAGRSLPRPAGIFGAGGVIGGVSSLLGVGGGVFNVPFLLSGGVQVKQAVGTSAALSWAIALTGALSYLLTGLRVEDLPEGTLGFTYLPIALGLVVTTIPFAPLGARLAHRLSPRRLQVIFGIMLILVSTRILFRWVL